MTNLKDSMRRLVMIGVCIFALASVSIGQTPNLTYVNTLSGVAFPGRLAPLDGGGVYVTDQVAGTVIEYDAAGNLVNTFAIPEKPIGIAVHPDGWVFIARADGSVGRYDSGFVLQELLDPNPMALARATALAIHPITGELFVVDSAGDQVLVFAKDITTGTWPLDRAWGMEGALLSQFQTPQAIAVDPQLDHVFVTDADNFRIQVFDTNGIVLFQFGYRILYFPPSAPTAWIARPEGIAVDTCGNIYVADALMGTVRIFDSSGMDLSPTSPPIVYGAGPGQLRIPSDVAISGTGLYVSNNANSAVEFYSTTCSNPAPAVTRRTTTSGLSVNRVTHNTDLTAVPRRTSMLRARDRLVDNPFNVAAAIRSGDYRREYDLNSDRRLDISDLKVAVQRFGIGSVETFLEASGSMVASVSGGFEAPHVLDIPFACGRCHAMNGMPFGITTAQGQLNLCQSCHTASGIADAHIIVDPATSGSHPIGVPADEGDSLGPDPQARSELVNHLDDGKIRCGTCHDSHTDDAGHPYLRAEASDGTLCQQCHRGPLAPTNHASNHTKYCTDCHSVHSLNNGNLDLVSETFDTWLNGEVSVTFTDNTTSVGPGAFVDPDPNVRGICEACHDYPSNDPNIEPPHVLDASMPLCSNCHKHENGFEPGLGLGLSSGEFVGADTCGQCHTGKHANWATTLHQQALVNITPFANTNPDCLPCHTVGFGQPSGFVDENTTPQLAGVQCENCHGTGSDHVNLAKSTNISVDLSAASCGSCHNGEHHPTFDQWSQSSHAVALSGPRNLPFFNDSCLECHSLDFRLAVEEGLTPPTVAEAQFGLDCATCHGPHGNTGNPNQLRLPLTQLCAECHTSEGALPGGTPHHPQAETLHGIGGFALDGTPLVGPNGTHTSIAEECVKCHVHAEPFDENSGLPANTGHTFEPNMKACTPCHTQEEATALVVNTQSYTQRRLDAIAPYFTSGDPLYVDPATLAGPELDQYNIAKFDYELVKADASLGVHNGNYARTLLTETETFFAIGGGITAFVGSPVCGACHQAETALQTVHSHSHKLTKVNGGPPTFPPEGIFAGIPSTPAGTTWNDVSYVIGGYFRKARFITPLGNIMIGASGGFDGAVGVETQWNLEFPPGGSGLNWVFYHATDTQPKQYNYSCFQCHTTGPQEVPGNFEDWAEPSVQCEACHQGGATHITAPSPANITVDTTAAQCGTCHIRGSDPQVVLASGGYIRHHEQYPELLAGPHKTLTCAVCHEPHTSSYYDTTNGIRVECTSCHSDKNLGDHASETFVRGTYSEPLTCESCHMPYATKSATAADPSVIGPDARMGDMMTHIFSINTAAVDYTAMFTADLGSVVKDSNGKAAVTLDFACLRCHNGIGNAPSFTLQKASDEATNYHGSTP